jgi:hypothetical protein
MPERKHSGGLLAVVAILLGFGMLMAWNGVAAARDRTAATYVLTIAPSDSDAVLQLPSPACPFAHPTCAWKLEVWEVSGTGETLVGSADGASGILTAHYPAGYCGEIQADALVDRSRWRIVVGHRQVVAASPCTGPVATSQVPFTSVPVNPPNGDGGGATGPVGGMAQLPFTGVDVQPLAAVGSALIVAGLLVLSTVEQRRRAFLRAGGVMTPHVAAARRLTWWLFGE